MDRKQVLKMIGSIPIVTIPDVDLTIEKIAAVNNDTISKDLQAYLKQLCKNVGKQLQSVIPFSFYDEKTLNPGAGLLTRFALTDLLDPGTGTFNYQSAALPSFNSINTLYFGQLELGFYGQVIGGIYDGSSIGLLRQRLVAGVPGSIYKPFEQLYAATDPLPGAVKFPNSVSQQVARQQFFSHVGSFFTLGVGGQINMTNLIDFIGYQLTVKNS